MYVTRVGINTDSDYVGYEWNIRCNNEGRGEREERAKLFTFLLQSILPFLTIHCFFCEHFFPLSTLEPTRRVRAEQVRISLFLPHLNKCICLSRSEFTSHNRFFPTCGI